LTLPFKCHTFFKLGNKRAALGWKHNDGRPLIRTANQANAQRTGCVAERGLTGKPDIQGLSQTGNNTKFQKKNKGEKVLCFLA
jgi:hypothetical protein